LVLSIKITTPGPVSRDIEKKVNDMFISIERGSLGKDIGKAILESYKDKVLGRVQSRSGGAKKTRSGNKGSIKKVAYGIISQDGYFSFSISKSGNTTTIGVCRSLQIANPIALGLSKGQGDLAKLAQARGWYNTRDKYESYEHLFDIIEWAEFGTGTRQVKGRREGHIPVDARGYVNMVYIFFGYTTKWGPINRPITGQGLAEFMRTGALSLSPNANKMDTDTETAFAKAQDLRTFAPDIPHPFSKKQKEYTGKNMLINYHKGLKPRDWFQESKGREKIPYQGDLKAAYKVTKIILDKYNLG
jgi:hypothetical protein